MRGGFKFTGNIAKTPDKLKLDTFSTPLKSTPEIKTDEPNNSNTFQPEENYAVPVIKLKNDDVNPFQNLDKKNTLQENLDSDKNDEILSIRTDDFDDLTGPDVRKVRLTSLYLDKVPRNFSMHMMDSTSAVHEVIDKIIKLGASVLEDNAMDARLPEHSMELFWEMIEAAIDANIIGGDKENGSFNDDQEPEPPRIDNWIRSKIIVEKRSTQDEQLKIKDMEIKESQSISSDSKLSMNRVFAERAKNLGQAKELVPEIIDLQENKKEDATEETLRQRKEDEKKKEQEERQIELQRKEEIKKSQLELNKQLKEKKVKNFTYDYDGKIIMIQQAKTDKFGPILYPVSSNIRDPPVETNNDKKGFVKKKRDRPPPQVTKQKQTPAEDKEFVKIVTTTPLFETFSLNPGVTLMHDGKIRIEPRPNTASLANLTEPGLRLSRADYISLTKTGNLTREGLSKTLGQTLAVNEPRQIASAGDMQKGLENTYLEENLDKKKKAKKKDVPAPAIVKINSTKIFETLTNTISEMDEFEENLKSKVVQEEERKRLEKKNAELAKSPVDDFNLQIMNARDWGRSLLGAGGAINQKTQQPLKANPNQFKQTLGISFTKKPRNRIVQQETVKTNLKFLPPPMVGKTLGHGLYADVMKEFNKTEEAEN